MRIAEMRRCTATLSGVHVFENAMDPCKAPGCNETATSDERSALDEARTMAKHEQKQARIMRDVGKIRKRSGGASRITLAPVPA